MMDDERIRSDRSNGSSRKDRAVEMTEAPARVDREISDDERVEAFRMAYFQHALPDLPKIPGYHVCWLTTTNPRDSIAHRVRLGYEPVKPEDVPGFDVASMTMKTGEYAGLIGINEMLAFKIRDELYLRYMQEAHHNLPREEEQKLVDAADAMRRQAQSSGADVFEGDGIASLRAATPRPRFSL